MLSLCVDAEQLRKALRDIEAAENNGFDWCLAVFDVVSAGQQLTDCRARYSDMVERAHPTHPALNWGRFQGVTRRHRFVRGKLVAIKAPALAGSGTARTQPRRSGKRNAR